MRLRDGRTNRVPELHATASHVLLPGLRFTDPHIRNEILPATSQRYKKCVSLFMSFCILYQLHFAAVDGLDDLLAERKNTASPSKSEFEGVIAGIKHVLPDVSTRTRPVGSRRDPPTWQQTSVESSWPTSHELACVGASVAPQYGRREPSSTRECQFDVARPCPSPRVQNDVMLPEDRAQGVKQ